MSTPSTLKQSLHAVTALAFKTFGSPASPAISDYSSTPTIGKAGFQNDDKAETTSLTPHALHQAFRSYLSTDPEVASSHPHLSYYSSQTDTQFNALAHNVYKEVVRRDAMTPVPQLSPPRTSSVPVNPLYRHDFSRYSDENLKAVVRNVDAELVRRHPQVAEITNGIFAPQPRRAGTTIPSDVTSAQLPSIRHVQSSRRMLTPDGGRRLSICTVPARIQSPLRRASSRSPASSPYSSEYDWVSSDLGSDDIGDDVESCGESPVVGNKFRARELRRRDSEIHRLKGQLVEAQTKLQDTEAHSLALRSLLCPWAAPPESELGILDQEKDVQARLLLRDALTTSSADCVLACRSELVMSLLKLMQRTLDHHRRNTDEPKFLHGNHLGRLIVKLSRRSQVIPDSLHITGVEDVSHDVYECGGFADIFIAKWNQQSVALKRLRIFKSTHNDSSVREAFYREAIVWRQLEHRFILPFYGIDNETFSNAPTMVSPLILGGNVHKAMLTLSPNDIPYNRWLLEISQGLEYLHDQDIVHGDVRGANILIDSQGHVKMADFGLAFFSGASTVSFGPNAGGATRWLAPELLEVEDKVRLPTYACDVFSFGRVCIELYTRQKPFPDIILDIQVTPHVIRGGCPVRPTCETGQEMSEELWELVQSCWSREPTHRPTISQVVQNLSAQLV